MCCFSKPVYSVTNTEIYVQACGARQVTVYANRVSLANGVPTAMILPVPCADAAHADTSIRVLDMTDAGPLFETLFHMFPSGAEFGRGARSQSAAYSDGAAAPLAVHRSGSYRYSVVPTLEDFARLQHEVYGLAAASELAVLLRTHYPSGFAFLACIIDRDAHFAPIAYEHAMHDSGRVFVPTLHYHGPHGAAVHGPHWLRHTLGGNSHADWDHVIYSVGCTAVAADTSKGLAHSVPLADDLHARRVRLPFPVPRIVDGSLVRKRDIKGHHANVDLWLTPDAALRTAGCTRLDTGATYTEQDWFTCTTCALQRGEGMCGACARTCHAGHATTYAGRVSSFCDCGTGSMAAAHVACACK